MNDRREWLLVRADGVGEARIAIGSQPVRIGRGPENQIVLPDTYASARHAEVVEHEGQRWLRDLGSTNGTRLNGRVLAPGTLHALGDGDLIQIGASTLTYRCGHASGAPGEPSDVALPAPSPRSGRFWPRIGRVVLWASAALVATVVIAAGLAWALAPTRVTLLVMGSDARPDELRRGAVGRTDTMLTVVADRSPSGMVLISVPRDLWVSIPGYGEERINAAYELGGARAAERTVGDVLGVPVDRFLVIGLQDVRDVVDAAGGVDIVVDQPIHDDAYPTDDYGTVVVDIPAGRQHMDGETALRYARTRHQDNDFGRLDRQQRVVLALRDAVLQPGNWWRLPAVFGAMRRAAQTDLDLLDLATLALAVGSGATPPERLAIDLSLVEELQGGDGAYLLRPRPILRQRVAAVLDPTSAAVEVLNGTSTAGLATQVADRLRGRKMRVVNVGNAARTQADTAVEIRPGLTRAGLYTASILDLPRDAVRESLLLADGVDVRITLGDGRARP